MKFKVNSKNLLSRLVASGKAIDNKPTISILGCFLLSLEESELGGATLTITASNSETTVVSKVDVDGADGFGKVCINAKRLTELLKSMPNCPVNFDIDEENEVAHIRHPKGKYKLSTVSANDYPLKEDIDPESVKGSFTVTSAAITSAFDKVGFAISTDEIRPMMCGIYWDITPEAITFVATDTHVLAKYRNTQTAPGIQTSFILPGHCVNLIRAFITKESDIKVTCTNNMVAFEGSGFKVQSTLIKGNYPNYNRVIPENPPISVTVDRDDFADAITRVAICTDNQNSLIRFKLSSNNIDALAQDVNFGVGGEESINCEYAGDKMDIGFSYTYLKGIINVINTQKMFLKLSSFDRPGLFLPAENDEHGELTLLCMPLNIINAD